MKHTMKLIVALLIPVVAFAQSRRFDLKGDILGETLATFKARHPRVSCNRFSDAGVFCDDDTASFAGHRASAGLQATFFRGRLTRLEYTVYVGFGGAADLLDTLTKKFGNPTALVPTPHWQNRTQQLSLRIIESEYASIALTYMKDPESRDI